MHKSTTVFRLPCHRSTRAFARLAFLASAACVLTTTVAQAQLTYSIEFQGPTIGLPAANPAMGPIGAGDLLGPAPGAATPWIRISAASIGIVPSATTWEPEVDALSFGTDPLIFCDGNPPWLFSVDEFAVGIPSGAPDVASEGAFPAANQEASADVFGSTALPSMCPGAAIVGNTGFADGNGAAPFAAPGLNLIEPNPPTPGPAPDPGDNLDALACSTFAGQIFFSLDAAWADPVEGPAVHSGTALANGVSPGAVLVSNPGGVFSVFATPFQLGLSLTDDLDALLLRDNGNGTFDPSIAPFDWMNGLTDMLLFSVKRGSPLVGVPDAINGVAIEESDILTVTANGPGILVFAEALGLWTLRTNGASPLNIGLFGDNLDALSVQACSQNGAAGDPAG